MDVILFLSALLVSFIVERVGAVAFELTGLDWHVAKFQALSCFTGTGFTTKEAEVISSHPQRRSIAGILMILGHAGLVTMVATFANTLRSSSVMPKIFDFIPGHFVPWINVLIIVVVIFIGIKIFNKTKLATSMTEFIKRHIIKKNLIKPVSFEELMFAGDGYGLCQIEIWQDSPVLDQHIGDLAKKYDEIKILMVGKKGRKMKLPSPDTKIQVGDKLLCFGKIDHVKKKLNVEGI